MKTIAFTPRQYRSHIDRNLGWPPMSRKERERLQHFHYQVCNKSQKVAALLTPNFDRDISFRYFAHVEANCWNHVFTEVAALQRKHTKQIKICSPLSADINRRIVRKSIFGHSTQNCVRIFSSDT